MGQFAKLFSMLGRYWPLYLSASLMLIASTFIRMLEPRVFQVAVDLVARTINEGGRQHDIASDFVAKMIYWFIEAIDNAEIHIILMWLAVIYFVIAIVRSLLMFGGSALASWCAERSIFGLRNRLFSHIQHLPLSFHKKTPTGDFIQRCTGDVETIRQFLMNQVVELLRLLAVFGGAFWMMWLINPQLAFICVSLVPLIGISSYLFFRKEKKVWRLHEKAQDRVSSVAEENISGIRVVKAFTAENAQKRSFEEANLHNRAMGNKHLMLHAWFWPISDLVVNLQITLSVMTAAYFAMQATISIGEMAAVFSYALMVTWPMRAIGRIVTRMGMAVVASERIEHILSQDTEDYQGSEAKLKLKGKITFKNVNFGFKDEKDEVILKNLSFTIQPGERVALMGATGSGKSTLIALLLRFYKPDSGEIYIDDLPVNTYPIQALRLRIGVVLQQSFLFTRSIKENIAYTLDKKEYDEHIVREAAKDAAIDEIIQKFPNAYQTVVGEKGVTLSGGQKQRLALARTLLSEPDILVLDDATSAVDTETEYHINKALKKRMQQKSTILITHRISSVMELDKVLLLESGSIVAFGKPQELLKENELFKNMYRQQQDIEDLISNELKATDT